MNANAIQSSSNANANANRSTQLLLKNIANQLELNYETLKSDPTGPIKSFSLEGLPKDLSKHWTKYHLFGQMYKRLVTRTQGTEIVGATSTGSSYYSYINDNFPKCEWLTEEMKKFLEDAHERAGPNKRGGGSRSSEHLFKNGFYIGKRVVNVMAESAVTNFSDLLADLDMSYSVKKNKGKMNETGENDKRDIVNDIIAKYGAALENAQQCVDAVAELNRVWIIAHNLKMDHGKKDPQLIEANANVENAKKEVGRVAFEALRSLIAPDRFPPNVQQQPTQNLGSTQQQEQSLGVDPENATLPVPQSSHEGGMRDASSSRTTRRRGTRRRTSNNPNDEVGHNDFETSASSTVESADELIVAGLGRRPRRTTTLPMARVGA